MIRRPPRSTHCISSAASDVYKRQIMQRIKKRLQSRGVKGFLQLHKYFLILDTDNDQKVDPKQFKKAIKDSRIDVTDSEIDIVFNIFDAQYQGLVDFMQFLQSLKGDINHFRLELIDQVFEKIDTDKDGLITVGQAKIAYQARNHPDVINAKKNEDDIINEFVESLLLHHQIKGGAQNEIIQKEEFFEYYHYVSASIEDDKLFETLLVGCFKLSHESQLYKNYAGSKQIFDPDSKKSFLLDHHRNLIYGGTVSQNAPFGTFNEPTDYKTANKPIVEQNMQKTNQSNQQSFRHAGYNIINYQQEEHKSYQEQKIMQYEQNTLLQGYRDKIFSRGVRGFLNLIKQFRTQDKNMCGKLNLAQFTQAFKQQRIEISESELLSLFVQSDSLKTGFIDFMEFVEKMKGQLTEFRKSSVIQAFALIDFKQQGYVTYDEVINKFNPIEHPLVKQGKQQEEEVIQTFLDTFEANYQIFVPVQQQKQRIVHLNDFLNYYSMVSASTNDDTFFDQMMRSCWNIDKMQPKKNQKN
eukprot:TRINITY_DN1390_c0_g1_i9.p1 TRINITY_DN1390_c0_g1~~TRINITY_DN1390_c0_g1_i9.p1  ORF type:complete len:523 (+),score=123.87 TRINITY_DN1390_c0_g1_i9:62-1630(+)